MNIKPAWNDPDWLIKAAEIVESYEFNVSAPLLGIPEEDGSITIFRLYDPDYKDVLKIIPKGWIRRNSQLRFGIWHVKLWNGDKSFKSNSDADSANTSEILAMLAAGLRARAVEAKVVLGKEFKVGDKVRMNGRNSGTITKILCNNYNHKDIYEVLSLGVRWHAYVEQLTKEEN